MSKLSDIEKGKILADRLEGVPIRRLAEKYNVSTTTIQRVIKSDTEMSQKVTQKRNQNVMDMLEYMDSRKGQAQGIIDTYLEALADPEKLESASLQQIATALGIVVDKFTKTTPAGENALSKLDEVLKEIGGVI